MAFLRLVLWTWIFSVAGGGLHAQLVDVSQGIPLSTDHTSGFLGTGVSVADFDGDGWDDVSFGHHGGQLAFYHGSGSGYAAAALGLTNGTAESKGLLWADFNNDGHQDLFVANRLSPNRLWWADGNGGFVDGSTTSGLWVSNARSYGACAGDYDRDGDLDLFVANYVHSAQVETPRNELYRNNGNGTFTDVTYSAGVGTPVIQSFQGQWVDFNEDGWLDLHVIVDRTIFPNLYYENQGNGTFVERANEVGLNIMINAMSTSVADYDRDGDMDVYVTGGLEGNRLLENVDGFFSEFIPEPGGENLRVNSLCWAACWMDEDNDGWEDVYVTTGYTEATVYPDVYAEYILKDKFFRNTGGQFLDASEEVLAPGNNLSFAAAPTDFNRDGFLDFISHRVGPTAQVRQGTPNGNHYLRVRPVGTVSNRDGVGTKVKIWVDGQQQYRMAFAGENYLGQNSRWLHFGLGPVTVVDSMIVTWPLGLIERYYNVDADNFLVLTEGAAMDCPPGVECEGCTYPAACNFDAFANADDGSCDFSCCTSPAACGPGTVWSQALAQCVPVSNSLECHADLNDDGSVTVGDLMLFLSAFAQVCEE
jgi:hypothetical protein